MRRIPYHQPADMLTHASKVLLRVLTKRLQSKAEADRCLGEDQFELRKEISTRDALGAPQMMAERRLENIQEDYTYALWTTRRRLL